MHNRNNRNDPRYGATRNNEEARMLRERSNNVTSETVSKTRNMLRLMNESKDAGVNTLQNLHSQGEQLNTAENALDQTDANLSNAETRLENIRKAEEVPCCCLPCVSCCQKDPDKNRRKEKKKCKCRSSKEKDTRGKVEGYGDNQEHGRYFEPIHGTHEEDEIERNLDHVSNQLSDLHMAALDMNSEVNRQNEQIDRMNNKAEKSLARVDAATDKAKDLAEDKKRSRCCFCC